MAAEIIFFCTPPEELELLEHLVTSGEVVAFDRLVATPQVLPIIDVMSPPTWPVPSNASFGCGPLAHSSGTRRSPRSVASRTENSCTVSSPE